MYEETDAAHASGRRGRLSTRTTPPPFAGSSDPLHRAMLAFTSKDKPLVMSDPDYEAGGRAAQFIGAVVRSALAEPRPRRQGDGQSR